jgi:O-antigen ligase
MSGKEETFTMITNTSRPVLGGGQSKSKLPLPTLGGSAAIIAIVTAMAFIVPLLSGSTFLTNVGKVLAFEVLGAALVTMLLMNINTQGLVQRFKENAMAGPNLLVLAVALCAVVSFAFGATSKWLTASEVVRVVICTAVYFGVLYNVRGRLTQITDVILGVAAAVAVFGLVSVGDKGFDQLDGVSGTFGTHEALGSFLMLMLPITAAMGIFNKKDEKRKIAALAVSLLVTVCLAFTQSRSGWISELVALGALALLSAKFYGTAKSGTKPRLISLVPFLAFAGIAGLMLAISGSASDVLHRASTLGMGSTDISIKERLMLWQAAISMVAAKPLFGWGLGSFPFVASHYTSVAASGAYVAQHGINLRNIAHNYYLQTAAETGIVGLGLYVSMVVTFFVVGVRALGKLQDGTRKMVLIGVLAAMAGQVVDAMTSPSYNIASLSMFQWLLMGVAMFAAGVPKQSEETVKAATPIAIPASRVRTGMRAIAGVTACLIAATGMLATANSAVADTYITVHHDRGVSDTDAWLIGIGGLAAGYFIGDLIEHDNGGHNH